MSPPVSRRSFVNTAVAGGASALVGRNSQGAAGSGEGSRGGVGSVVDLSLAEAAELVRSRKVSPVELTRACLDRISALNPKLNAFITVTAESALAAAREAEAEQARGALRGPLHGIPVALKDLLDTAGVRTTAASALYENRVPERDAFVVRRLREAGAVLLGKLNLHEFAYGGSSVVSRFGPVPNPWAIDHSSGGSSSGSAVAVAARLCYAAVGSDTGGSIRQPAAFCGIAGLKPTYGRVSTSGVIPLAWSLDHLGPMARTVKDAALLLQAMAGEDPQDPVSLPGVPPDYAAALASPSAPLRVGVARAHFFEGLHPEVGAAVEAALDALRTLGASVRNVDMPVNSDTAVLRAEAYAYHQEHLARSPELYQPETLRRIRAGAEVALVDYVRGRRQLDELRRSALKTFEAVDLVVTPTVPVPPFRIAALLSEPSELRAREIVTLRNTRPFNALGWPTLSVPCGFTQSGLPIGLQIAGRPGDEAGVLRMGHAYEQSTAWHLRRPPALEA